MNNYNISIFEKNINEYDLWYKKNKKIFDLEIKAIKKLILNIRAKKTLEIGAGTGRFTKALKITNAIEPSKKLVKYLTKNGINAFKAFGEKIPFKNKEFDIVFILFSLEFVKKPKQVLKEANRVLKNKGLLILGFLNKDLINKKSKFYKKANFFQESDILNILKESGFKILKKIKIIKDKNRYKIINNKNYKKSIVLFISAKKI